MVASWEEKNSCNNLKAEALIQVMASLKLWGHSSSSRTGLVKKFYLLLPIVLGAIFLEKVEEGREMVKPVVSKSGHGDPLSWWHHMTIV